MCILIHFMQSLFLSESFFLSLDFGFKKVLDKDNIHRHERFNLFLDHFVLDLCWLSGIDAFDYNTKTL